MYVCTCVYCWPSGLILQLYEGPCKIELHPRIGHWEEACLSWFCPGGPSSFLCTVSPVGSGFSEGCHVNIGLGDFPHDAFRVGKFESNLHQGTLNPESAQQAHCPQMGGEATQHACRVIYPDVGQPVSQCSLAGSGEQSQAAPLPVSPPLLL